MKKGYSATYNPAMTERAKNMRNNMTKAEFKLWYDYLKNYKYKVYRQRPILNYIVDFYCAKLKLIIEIDGETHNIESKIKYDQVRTKVFEKLGLKVIRFTNEDILTNFYGVCSVLEDMTPSS